jgi:hypothetical protein
MVTKGNFVTIRQEKWPRRERETDRILLPYRPQNPIKTTKDPDNVAGSFVLIKINKK